MKPLVIAILSTIAIVAPAVSAERNALQDSDRLRALAEETGSSELHIAALELVGAREGTSQLVVDQGLCHMAQMKHAVSHDGKSINAARCPLRPDDDLNPSVPDWHNNAVRHWCDSYNFLKGIGADATLLEGDIYKWSDVAQCSQFPQPDLKEPS
jgi:hypothetical protein